MESEEFVKCEICGVPVKKNNINRHKRKIHKFNREHNVSDTQNTQTNTFLSIPCSCGGENPQCFKCGGWGYIDLIGKARASPPGESPGASGIPNRYVRQTNKGNKRKRKKHKGNQPVIQAQFLSNEAKRKPSVRKGEEVKPNWETKKRENQYGDSALQSPESERRLDATRLYAHAYRDHGQFGSHASHDDYGDESES